MEIIEKKNEEFKHKVINIILVAAAIIGTIALIFVFFRDKNNINFYFFIQVGIIAALNLIAFQRQKLSLNIKLGVLITITLLVVISSLYSIGFLASAKAYIIIAPILASFIFPYKRSIVLLFIYVLTYIIFGFLHIKGILSYPVDIASHVLKPQTWITDGLILFLCAFCLLYVGNLFYTEFNKYIIELIQKNQKIEENTNKFLSVVESSNDGYIFVDEYFKIKYVNRSYLELCGYKKEELIGKHYGLLLEEVDFDWDDYFTSLATETNRKRNAVELDIIHKSGKRIPLEVNIYKIEDKNSFNMWAVVRDLRDKKELENRIFTSMINAEENERERYAKELHDGLGPLLSTSMIYLNSIIEDTKVEEIKDFANRTFDLLKESVLTIKEISNNLSPIILKDYGLPHAVRSFIEKTQSGNDINFKITDNLPARFAEHAEITLYRMLIELINNSIKYARAKTIHVDFELKSNNLNINYSDDGEGFDYSKALENNMGYGLLNLESRIKKLGGKYKYETSPGNGVKVIITLKLSTND